MLQKHRRLLLRKDRKEKSYSGPEIQLLNTGLSGVYLSAKDLMNIGEKAGVQNLALKSRELILKQLFSETENLDEVKRLIRVKIDAIAKEYKTLGDNYPESRNILFPMIQKANGMKARII
jgi:hypothetical protein